MRNLAYAVLIGGAAGSALAWSRLANLGWWRSRTGWLALGLVAMPFLIWDVVATAAGHWSFNPAFALPWRIGGLPLEEWLFFVSIPMIGLTVWEVLGRAGTARPNTDIRVGLGLVVAGALGLLAVGRPYSVLAGLVSLMVAGWWWHNRARVTPGHWWQYQAVLLTMFLIANTYLTALPIVEYGLPFFSGVRLGTIPLEDFWYNFTLINAVVLAYERLRR